MQPKMRTGHVEMVPVEWIMQNASDSVDGYGSYENGRYCVNYERMLLGKGCDWQFGQLINTIMTQGFRYPIVLVKDFLPYNYDEEDDEYRTPEFIEQNRLVHGNGHHRMIAAILLGLDEIPVYWSEGDEYMCSDDSTGDDVLIDPDWENFEDWLYSVISEKEEA